MTPTQATAAILAAQANMLLHTVNERKQRFRAEVERVINELLKKKEL